MVTSNEQFAEFPASSKTMYTTNVVVDRLNFDPEVLV